MTMTHVRVTTDIELTVELAAEWFCGLDDDTMAKFLTEIALRAKAAGSAMEQQWFYLGGHLRSCPCVPEETRQMLRDWIYWMEHSDHGQES